MPREKLIPPDNADDRSFEEQMNDLGVEVINKNVVEHVRWVRPERRKGGRKRLGMGLSVKTRIFLWRDLVKTLDLEALYLPGVGDYRGAKVLLLKLDPAGYKIVKHGDKKQGYSLGTERTIESLAAQGISRGNYRLEKRTKKGVMIFVAKAGEKPD